MSYFEILVYFDCVQLAIWRGRGHMFQHIRECTVNIQNINNSGENETNASFFHRSRSQFRRRFGAPPTTTAAAAAATELPPQPPAEVARRLPLPPAVVTRRLPPPPVDAAKPILVEAPVMYLYLYYIIVIIIVIIIITAVIVIIIFIF